MNGRMLIEYEGEAYESFQDALKRIHTYGVTITTVEGEKVEAILVGPDFFAEDGATIRYIPVSSDKAEPYDISEYSDDEIVSAVVDRITVT